MIIHYETQQSFYINISVISYARGSAYYTNQASDPLVYSSIESGP